MPLAAHLRHCTERIASGLYTIDIIQRLLDTSSLGDIGPNFFQVFLCCGCEPIGSHYPARFLIISLNSSKLNPSASPLSSPSSIAL